nr:histidine kinase [Nakamurella aerolata]
MFVWLYQRQIELRTSLEVANISLHATRELLAASTRSGERTRIARDLHDVLGHQLTALALELEVAAHTADPGTAQHIKRALRTAKSMLTEVRATVGALRDRGESVQEALLCITNGVTAPQIDLTVDASSIRSPEVRTAVVLGVQEIVTNAIRHAQARTLRVDVRTESGSMIVIDASDDGIARDPILAGNGLTGMRERFESLGGSVHFSVAGGFRITAMVPA